MDKHIYLDICLCLSINIYTHEHFPTLKKLPRSYLCLHIVPLSAYALVYLTSSSDEHLSCLQVFTITNNTCICMRLLEWI